MAKAVAQAQFITISTHNAYNTSFSEAEGLKTVLYTFLANMVEAESIDESVEDMTAALIAPKPKNATQVGVKYCKHRGKTNEVSVFSGTLPKSVWVQSMALAIIPNVTDGTVMIRAIRKDIL